MTTHGKVLTTGLYVRVSKPWLTASHDGLVEDPSKPPEQCHSLLEIKFPYPSTVCTESKRFHSKKSSSAHIGNWFVHVREQTVSIPGVSHLETVRK